MPLPSEINNSIDEIRTPSNKVLVKCLILAVISLVSVVVYLDKTNKSMAKECNESKLRYEKIIEDNLIREREYFKEKFEMQDSAERSLNKLIKK